MSAERQDFDEEVYDEEVDYDGEYDDEDGMIEEIELDESEGPGEELGAQGRKMHIHFRTLMSRRRFFYEMFLSRWNYICNAS
jgi:hypothetical protein